MNMNRKKVDAMLKRIEIEKALKAEVAEWKSRAYEFQKEAGEYAEQARVNGLKVEELSGSAARLFEERNRLAQAAKFHEDQAAALRAKVEQQEGYRKNLCEQRERLISEVEEKRKRIQQLKGEQMFSEYKMGVGTMPLGEEERGRWRNRLHDQLARVGLWKGRTMRRIEIIKDLRQRLADMRDLIPQGFGRPEVQEKADAILEGANLRRVYPVCPEHQSIRDYGACPKAQGEFFTNTRWNSGIQYGGTLASFTAQAQAAERAAEQEVKMKKAVAEEVAKQMQQQMKNAPGEYFLMDVIADMGLKGQPKKKPLTKKKRK